MSQDYNPSSLTSEPMSTIPAMDHGLVLAQEGGTVEANKPSYPELSGGGRGALPQKPIFHITEGQPFMCGNLQMTVLLDRDLSKILLSNGRL